MKRFLYTLLLSCCAAAAGVCCTDDPTKDPLPSNAEGETWVTLDFGDHSFDEINITTRATLDGSAEGRVSNLFVFLFNSAGERVYGRFFDNSNRKETEAELNASKVDSWWVKDNSDKNTNTSGKVRMYAPEITTGGSLYILANINADMVNISPDKLRFVQKLDDLKAMTATLNQEITERNGFFPMTGMAEGITITSGSISSTASDAFSVKLERIDAKITVKVRAAAGYESSFTDETTNITTKHKIKEFVPLSWQVVNLPRAAFVLPQAEDAASEFFNSKETKFETREADAFSFDADNNPDTPPVKSDVHGFSFYMLENRSKYKSLIPGDDYHLRDKRRKNADGTYNTTDGLGLWEYAPEKATYLIIKGEVIMDLDLSNEAKAQQLSADVVYYIHLGDFASDFNDYNVKRNTSYTYTITIKGVDKIQVEVEQDKEDQSGATGHVYVAKEAIFTFDAHFGRTLIAFDEAHLTDVQDLSWYVKTPFGREGKPNVIGGIEVPSGLDYKWVHFIINEHNDEKYNTKLEKFNPAKAMNILEFSKYIKEQVRLFKNKEKNDFRSEYDKDWAAKFPDQPDQHRRNRIYVTIFVDEFYYAADPITGDVRTDLWKDFVNQPNRMMHILCDADVSKDEESRTTGSIVTIRQRSIQTMFNTEKPELQTAWGCETIDETRDSLWYYSRNESYDANGDWVQPSDVHPSYQGNDSSGNGLYNTAKIWGLTSNGSYQPKLWSDFIDFDQKYELCDADDKETLRYSCLTRNRDENGDGIIDASEIKWYLASINQLASLYVGDQGLNSDAVLYPYYKQRINVNEMDAGHAYPWRAHIVSSTNYTGNYPEIMWAEEGLSTGAYNETWHKSAGLSVRCVRNLGMDPIDENDARKKLLDRNHMPEQAIRSSGPGLNGNSETVSSNSTYRFDMTNMNPLSIRYYSSRELEPNNEYSMEARVYWGFETGPKTTAQYTYDALYKLLKEGKSPCPEGYRVPNVREAALMALRCPVGWSNSYGRVSTFYSHGSEPYGSNMDTYQGCKSWLFNDDRIRLDDNNSAGVRCVKDIRP